MIFVNNDKNFDYKKFRRIRNSTKLEGCSKLLIFYLSGTLDQWLEFLHLQLFVFHG